MLNQIYNGSNNHLPDSVFPSLVTMMAFAFYLLFSSDSSDPFVILAGVDPVSAGIIGGANVVNGVMNMFSTKHSNATNAQIARETNAQNYQMFHEQLGFTKDMWDASNLYNTPVAQRKRMEQAGINPYMALGNMNTGNAELASTPAPNPAITGAPMQPYNFDFIGNGTRDALLAANQVDGLNLDNEAKRIDLITRSSENLARLDGMIADNKKKGLETSVLETQRDSMLEELDILRSSKSERKAQAKLATRRMELENDGQELQNKWQDFQNELAKELKPYQIEQLKASIAVAYSEVKLNNANAGKAVAEKALAIAHEKGVRIDNYQKNQLNWLIREGVKLDNKMKKYNISHPGYVSRFIGDLGAVDNGINNGMSEQFEWHRQYTD